MIESTDEIIEENKVNDIASDSSINNFIRSRKLVLKIFTGFYSERKLIAIEEIDSNHLQSEKYAFHDLDPSTKLIFGLADKLKTNFRNEMPDFDCVQLTHSQNSVFNS